MSGSCTTASGVRERSVSPPVVPVPGCKKSAYDVISARKDTSTYMDLAKKSGAALINIQPAEYIEILHGKHYNQQFAIVCSACKLHTPSQSNNQCACIRISAQHGDVLWMQACCRPCKAPPPPSQLLSQLMLPSKR